MARLGPSIRWLLPAILSACLPMVLQIPVFISLVYMLRKDLKQHICGPAALRLHPHLTDFSKVNCNKLVPHSASFLFVNDITTARYPGCGPAMARAYRAIARASAMTLTYGDVLRPPPEPADAPRRRSRLLEAAAAMREGIAASEAIIEGAAGELGDVAQRLEVGA